MLQLVDLLRHCLLSAKQALGLGHGSISHRCDSGVCGSFQLSLGDKLLAGGDRYILDLEKEASKTSHHGSFTTPALPGLPGTLPGTPAGMEYLAHTGCV